MDAKGGWRRRVYSKKEGAAYSFKGGVATGGVGAQVQAHVLGRWWRRWRRRRRRRRKRREKL
jgi:hypothetical protein